MMAFFGNWRKKRALDKVQVDDAQWAAVEAHLPFLDHLSPDERQRLRDMARQLLAEKEWTGAQGLQLTPRIQLSIALQACLPVLNIGLEHYRGWVGIVVYPGDFIIPRNVMDADGVVHEYDDHVLGEAWEGGPVLVSWFDDPDDAGGVNIVIHEFAHKLDMENGIVDGMPRLPAEMSRKEWIAAFEPAYEDFCRRVDAADLRGEETLLDPYGSEHPSEFFAVMSEAFFETPEVLRDEYPAVYEQLRRYYGQNPAAKSPA
jgi:Mlc titration factor MtfA (ptsG expression regulator)